MRKQGTTLFLLVLAAILLYLCYLIAKPFLGPIFAAIVIAIVFYPLHVRVQSFIRRRNAAATLSTVLVLLIVTIPAVVLGVTVTREIGEMYHALSQETAAQGGVSPYVTHLIEKPLAVIGKYVDLSEFDFRAAALRGLEQASRYLLSIGPKAVRNIFSLALGVVVAFFTLFFLFRDGHDIREHAVTALPLTLEQANRLFVGINQTIVANVHGGIAVGTAQGSLTGLAFWVLGLSSPIVWGLVTAMVSLIPLVGTAVIWVPAAAIVAISGHWVKALILLGWGAAVVSQVDALIRPYVIGERVKTHTLLVFFALLGGVRAFGILGLFIGPVVLSVTIAVLDMLREMNLTSQAIEQNPP